jgi:hypothetical protein
MFAKTTKEIAGYVGRTYRFGGDTRTAIESEEAPKFAIPDDVPEGAGKGAVRMWEQKIDAIAKREDQLNHNLRQLFALIWGQCTEVLQQRVEAEEGFAKMSNENDGLLLLKTIKNITYRYQSQKYVPDSLFESKKRFYMQSQGKLSTAEYHTQFMNLVAVIKHCGGSTWDDVGVEEMILRNEGKTSKVGMTKAEMKALAEDVEQRSLAVAFIRCSDRLRFGKLVEDMENNYLQGNNKYPTTVVAANHLLTNWKHDARLGTRDVNGGEISFVNDGDKKAGRANAKKEVTCHRCKQKGHYANECDNERVVDNKPDDDVKESKTKAQAGTTLLTLDGFFDDQEEYVHFQFLNTEMEKAWDTENEPNGVTMQIGNDGRLPSHWILLDNQSIRRCVMVSLPLHGEIFAVNGDNIVAFNNIFDIIDIHMGVAYTCMGLMH